MAKKPTTKKSTTSKSTTRKSTTKTRTKSAASRRQQARLNRIITLAVIVGVVILFGYYLMTGSDPLGLFIQAEATPTVRTAASVASVGGGDWWRVYFTDPLNVNDPDNLRGTIPEKLIAHINNAQRTIHIAAFEFDLTPVAEALIAAHQRGVEVLWVTDDQHHGQWQLSQQQQRDCDRIPCPGVHL